MKNADIRPDQGRWGVLLVFTIVTIVIEIQWLTFASVAREARMYYGVSAFGIDILSLIFMVVFLIVCIPASYVIDTFGIRIGIGIGALLTGIFGMVKGIFASDYVVVVVAQTGLAIAQPFILNAATKVAGVWFPINERAFAVGIATLAQFTGIIIVMILTPLLVHETPGGNYDLSQMLMIYGIVSAIGSMILLLFLKEKPETPPGEETSENRMTVSEGFRFILKQKDMKLILPLFFIGLGMFNAISTCIDQICQIKGLDTEQTGLVGGMMLIAGILGALILPAFSDKLKKRKLFIVLAMVLMTPGLVGLTFFTDYTLLLISSFIMGFFLLGAGAPIGFQYSAEVTYPAPESISQGLILLIGQISGILFIVGMNIIGMMVSMIIFVGLSGVAILLAVFLEESRMIKT